MLGLDLAQFLLSAQVDGAEPLALAPQPLQPLLDLGQIGQCLAFLDFGDRGDRGGLDLQHVVDFAANVGQPALGAFEAFLGAGQFLARKTGGFERCTGIAVGIGQHVLGGLQPVGAGAALDFRRLHFADQPRALLGKNLRCVFQLGAVALGFRNALLERGDLVAGAVAPLAPAGLVGRKLVEPTVGHFRFAHDRLLLGAHLGDFGAFAGDVVAHAREPAFEVGGRRQLGERALGLGLGGGGLVTARRQARARFGQRGQARRLAVEIALARPGFAFGLAGALEGRLRQDERLTFLVGLGTRARQFGIDLGEAAALRQPACGAGRRMGCRHEAVPTPQIAVARNEPLAGLERGAEPLAGFALDHADLCQSAGKLRRRLHVARQRLDALRQRRIAGVGRNIAPMHG